MTESQVSGKTQARHAIELIADYYESHDELGRAGVARRSMDSELLDVIRGGVARPYANDECLPQREGQRGAEKGNRSPDSGTKNCEGTADRRLGACQRTIDCCAVEA